MMYTFYVKGKLHPETQLDVFALKYLSGLRDSGAGW